MAKDDAAVEELGGETCPVCMRKTLTLRESEHEVPYFGKLYVFSMTCSNPECRYAVSDVEFEEDLEPCRYDFTVESEADLNARLVKGGAATVKVGRIATIEPGEAPEGYISNIEGLLRRVETVLEGVRDTEDDADARKKAKNQLKKLRKILAGQDSVTITVLDPSGNSAIIHEKAERKKLKKK